jgi:hypothetical protein
MIMILSSSKQKGQFVRAVAAVTQSPRRRRLAAPLLLYKFKVYVKCILGGSRPEMNRAQTVSRPVL